MNEELTNITKIIVNCSKDQLLFFPKIIKKDNIPLGLPNLKINSVTVECKSSIKFLGVRIDKNLTKRVIFTPLKKKLQKKAVPR